MENLCLRGFISRCLLLLTGALNQDRRIIGTAAADAFKITGAYFLQNAPGQAPLADAGYYRQQSKSGSEANTETMQVSCVGQ